ncbi:MAG: PQQ-dependent sugar dehydrogenase [Bryobacterales bacterium]|nr:PQQ-dependent sugar dehydrogenase [Bryobacterales bacterium]
MFLTLLVCLTLPVVAAKRAPKLPPPDQENSKPNPAKVIPRPEGAQFQVPSGFQVETFASGFKKPRFLLELPGGQVLVTDAVPDGAVYVVEGGKPGKALIRGLERPFGMALWGGYLYVGEPQSIKRYKLNTQTLEVGAGEEVMALKGYTVGHWTRAITFDRKGTMYVGVGSGSNVSAGDPADRATVLAANPDGGNRRIVAGGLRNAVSLRVHPVSGKLWASVQERDGLGDDLVPDFLTELKPGAFYGWPWAYIGPNEEPRRKGENPALVRKSIAPDVLLQSHVAVMDFVFYTGAQFPTRYRNGAFMAYRGSSNRAKRVGYSVEFLPFRGGKPAGKPEPFLSGFMLGEDQAEVWGRPVGLLQLSDGSLLLSEDGNHTIYRISYRR